MNPAKFSITDLERLTGIKAPTIRIWEKRYGIINPERTETNIRYYSTQDLQKLLNISFLNKHGYKISHISTMSDPEIEQEIARLSQEPDTDEVFLTELVMATNELDEDRFERVLNSSILKTGFESTFLGVVLPFLEKVGLLWQINKINACQERFVQNLIRHKLVVAIDGLSGHSNSTPLHYILFLPTGQYDEINLLFAYYLLRKQGHQVLYLGPSIPLDHLRSLSNREKIDGVLVNINSGFTEKEFKLYLESLIRIFPAQKLFVLASWPVDQSLLDRTNRKIITVRNFSEILNA